MALTLRDRKWGCLRKATRISSLETACGAQLPAERLSVAPATPTTPPKQKPRKKETRGKAKEISDFLAQGNKRMLPSGK